MGRPEAAPRKGREAAGQSERRGGLLAGLWPSQRGGFRVEGGKLQGLEESGVAGKEADWRSGDSTWRSYGRLFPRTLVISHRVGY